MAKPKFDGIIQAVRYKSDGKVDWVRAYIRRGPTFSDQMLLDRQSLLDQLKAGKQFWTGRRVAYLAGTFELEQPVRVANRDGQDFLVVGENSSAGDQLKGVPVI